MNVNNYEETALCIYQNFPFANYSYEDYVISMKIYEETKDINLFLRKIGCCDGLCHQILKTITITSNYFFKNKSTSEKERFSLEYICLFASSGLDKELKKERVKIIRQILANNLNMSSQFQVNIVELISYLYLIYCIAETFIGTTVIFFSLLPETNKLLQENKFIDFYNDFVLNDRIIVIEDLDYECVDYKELLIKYLGKDNSNQFFKILIEYFAGNKIELESIDEENIEEVILTAVKERFIVFDHINFDKLLESIPQFWNAKVNLHFLLSPK